MYHYHLKTRQKLVPLFEGGDSRSYRGEPSFTYALDDYATPAISLLDVDCIIEENRQ